VPSALFDIPLAVNVWPMSLKDSGCVLIDLHLPFALHAAAFKTKIKPTDSGKQTAERDHPRLRVSVCCENACFSETNPRPV
jgi:hypothetical protein